MDTSEKKTIQINPEFLRLPSSTKKTAKKINKPIKMKVPPKETNTTMRKRMMQHLRKQQDEMASNEDHTIQKRGQKGKVKAKTTKDTEKTKDNEITAVKEFKNHFEESLKYLENMSKRANEEGAEKRKPPKNKTFRKQPSSILYSNNLFDQATSSKNPILLPPPSIYNDYENVNIDLPMDLDDSIVIPVPPRMASTYSTLPRFPESSNNTMPMMNNIPTNTLPSPSMYPIQSMPSPSMTTNQSMYPSSPSMPSPNYGCLKNGSLPTYRNWVKTQRILPLYQSSPLQQSGGLAKDKKTSSLSERRAEIRALFKKKKEKANTPDSGLKKYMNIKKQRRILRRTFRLGKSKVHSRVSVLVSNKTMRNRIQNVCHDLHKTPIEEVRRFLVKKGFIRVGSTCPTDVLRKMYESSNLICGEVANHNSDNLLFNYLNHGI
jgi:hypothetical protein